MLSRLRAYWIVVALLVVAGCQKENPVQLNDNDVQSQDIEIERNAIAIEPLDPALPETAGFFLTSEKQFYGKLVVAATDFDSPTQHHEASLAQAVFLDRTQPVLFDGDTVAYRGDDAGLITIDNLVIPSQPLRLNIAGIPIDTIGVRYSLLNIDELGGHGFQYFGRHEYQWDLGGSGSLSSFHAEIDAPEKIHVISPLVGQEFSRSGNIPLRWQGGGSAVTILISDYQNGSAPKPILRLRLKSNRGRLLLPRRVLQLLPADRSAFLFTFSSESSFVMTLYASYGDNILVRAVTSHSVVYNLTR